MSELTDKYSKNFSARKKKEFEKRVRELAGQMSEESAIDLVLKELFDEKFYSGGRVGFQMGGIFSADPDKAVKFNLDGEIINLNPEFFNMFMGPFMNDPEMRKRRIDDLKQEIRRNQKIKKAAKGGLIDKPLGAGGKKSGPPPKRGPNPQGLNIRNNTVKTVKLEK
jgi:hypothetical protein|tara:strand:- start:226 stop:723 length:498 start_codon:yes stop_codon:yes gene_type:complete